MDSVPFTKEELLKSTKLYRTLLGGLLGGTLVLGGAVAAMADNGNGNGNGGEQLPNPAATLWCQEHAPDRLAEIPNPGGEANWLWQWSQVVDEEGNVVNALPEMSLDETIILWNDGAVDATGAWGWVLRYGYDWGWNAAWQTATNMYLAEANALWDDWMAVCEDAFWAGYDYYECDECQVCEDCDDLIMVMYNDGIFVRLAVDTDGEQITQPGGIGDVVFLVYEGEDIDGLNTVAVSITPEIAERIWGTSDWDVWNEKAEIVVWDVVDLDAEQGRVFGIVLMEIDGRNVIAIADRAQVLNDDQFGELPSWLVEQQLHFWGGDFFGTDYMETPWEVGTSSDGEWMDLDGNVVDYTP